VGARTLRQGKRFHRAFYLAILTFLYLIAATVLAAAPPEKKKLTVENIMDLLSGGVAVPRVTYLVLDHGVDFKLTPRLEKAFQDAGADPTLIVAIRKGEAPAPSRTSLVAATNAPENQKGQEVAAARAEETPPAVSPTPSKPPVASGQALTGLRIQSRPGGVAIYVDGELKGETDAQDGLLDIAPLKPGKHRLRATRQGYEDLEGPAEVVAGGLAETPVWLAQTQAPALTAASLPAGKKFLVRHVHRAVEGVAGPGYCRGWMIVNVGYVRFISTDSPHQYLMNTSEIRDAKAGSGMGEFVIKLDFGRKYDFVAVDDKGHEISPGQVLTEIRYSMGL
jgi:hypothetical protein